MGYGASVAVNYAGRQVSDGVKEVRGFRAGTLRGYYLDEDNDKWWIKPTMWPGPHVFVPYEDESEAAASGVRRHNNLCKSIFWPYHALDFIRTKIVVSLS